jgi:hypothetical protein
MNMMGMGMGMGGMNQYMTYGMNPMVGMNQVNPMMMNGMYTPMMSNNINSNHP